MQVTTKAIVLSSLKYGDTSLIVKAFTESDGIKSYLLKGVLSSKKGKLKPAYFMPLMQLEIVANHRNKGTLESIREVKVSMPYQSLHTNIVKNSVVLFLAEMLGNGIQEEEQDQGLFNYLEYSLVGCASSFPKFSYSVFAQSYQVFGLLSRHFHAKLAFF